MRRTRTGLLLALVSTLVGASPLAAQVAPTLTGSTGLFELNNAESLPSGRFSFSLFYSQSDRSAAASVVYPPGVDDPLRYGYGKLGLTAAFGLLDNWELSVTAGQTNFFAEDRAWSGVVGGHERASGFRHNETDKFRIGTKVVVNPRTKDLVKVALFGGIALATQSKNDPNAFSTYRADYDFGISGTYGVATVQMGYLLAGDQGEDYDVSNELRFGLGFGVPIIKNTLKGIFEINRVMYDGGTTKPDPYSEALLGARFGIGETGIVAGAAVRANIDRWVKYGNSPSNIGGLVQLSWSPQPPAEEEMKVSAAAHEAPPPPPAPAPAPEPAVAPAPAPPVAEAPPPPKPETSTTDEILFDTSKSRLTNIAKAILDGVALRLKNNLAATCTITAYTDPKEKGDHMKLAQGRADAAKDYLVKRHGIDASRIKAEAKGDAEAGGDATRNRRVVVNVAFP